MLHFGGQLQLGGQPSPDATVSQGQHLQGEHAAVPVGRDVAVDVDAVDGTAQGHTLCLAAARSTLKAACRAPSW